MKKLILVFLILINTLFCFTGCSNTVNTIAVPDKILVFSNGKQEEIDKNNSKFNEIINLTNNRFNKKNAVIKEGVKDDLISMKDEVKLGIEFLYLNKHTSIINGEHKIKFDYNKLFFPLDYKKPYTDYGNFMYYGIDGKYLSGPIGYLTNAKKIADLLKK